jgi:hypothetical protein
VSQHRPADQGGTRHRAWGNAAKRAGAAGV